MMKRLAMMTLVGAALLVGGNLYAQSGHGCCAGKKGADKGQCSDKTQESPSIGEATVITRPELVSLIEQGTVTIVDARDPNAYQAGHIDGAVLFSEEALPADKNARLVFYCGGTRCPAAGKAARKALELGYTNVMVFKDGWSGWKAS